jgi:hypothetical protein
MGALAQSKRPRGYPEYVSAVPLCAPPRADTAAGKDASFLFQIKIYKILC